MPRLWVGNFDFEYQLGSRPLLQLPRKLQEINRQLLPAILPLTRPGDFLWAANIESEVHRQELASQCRAAGIQLVWQESQLSSQTDLELSPWGWTPALIKWAEQHKWQAIVPEFSRIVGANSRQTSWNYESLWNIAPTGAGAFRDSQALQEYLLTIPPQQRWVIKAEFGMSGRERLLGTGQSLSQPQRNWLNKRFTLHEPVFFEPWLDRVAEASFHYHIAPTGTIQYLGQMALITDDCGRYLQNHPSVPSESSDWKQSRQWTNRLAEELARSDYFGPLSIDSMRYRTANGEILERPLQDINARWTMGRCAWEKFHGSAPSPS